MSCFQTLTPGYKNLVVCHTDDSDDSLDMLEISHKKDAATLP